MKRPWFYSLTAGLLLYASTVAAQVFVTNSVIDEIETVFTSLFDALREGDVKALRSHLPAEEYAQHRILLEKNKEYPDFLRNFYQGATLRVGRIESVLSAKDDVIGEFIVDFPGGDTTVTRMRLHRNNQGIWKIRKVLAGPQDQGESFGKRRR
jgi:hypothetical protein